MSGSGNALPEPPSFEPWAGRVRTARSAVAAGVFLFVGASAYTGGMPVADASLRAMAASIVAYFVAWGAALWLCSELYYAQIARIRNELMAREQERARQLSEIYHQRLGGPIGAEADAATTVTPMEPPAPRRAA